MKVNDDRFLSVVVGALVSYALLETFIAYARERHEQWREWYASFVQPFARHPGRREWLRDTLTREEMTVRQPTMAAVATNDDCGCNDAT